MENQKSIEESTTYLNHKTGYWEPVIPVPYYHSLPKWVWKRLTGYRDKYARKAQLFLPWQ